MTEQKPEECQGCQVITDDLEKQRTVRYGDEKYSKDSWNNWYCELCRNSWGAYRHNGRAKKIDIVINQITRIGWILLDEIRELKEQLEEVKND